MKQALLPLLASIIFCCAGCKKEEDTTTSVETVDATLIWTGDYAVDGCGFMLRTGEVMHKPINEDVINSSFRENSPTEVEATIINYHKTQRFCMAPTEINTIKIVEIRTR